MTFQICQCGAQPGYNHAEDCPYPCCFNSDRKVNEWIEAKLKLEKEKENAKMKPTINPVTVIPNDLKPGDRLGFKVIAVIGYNGDWAAYRGLTEWSDDLVASQGDKLSEDAARGLFYAPEAAELKYRR